MRHRVAGKVLNADTQHRLAMRRNLARSLFLHGRVVTTTAKAKAARRFIEKLITRAKRAVAAKADKKIGRFVHEVRVLARDVQDKEILRKLISEVAPAAMDRPGGYTRIVRDWKNQVGDNAPRAIFELVDRVVEAPPDGEDKKAAADADGPKSKKKKGKAGEAATSETKPAKAKVGAASPKGKGDDDDDD